MDTKDITLDQILTFCIIMENNQGIVGKSPDYIREKWHYCMGTTDINYLLGVLDLQNQAKFIRYRNTWKP
ncbi:hypothetical protein ES708_02370 [subsurface metagenome]